MTFDGSLTSVLGVTGREPLEPGRVRTVCEVWMTQTGLVMIEVAVPSRMFMLGDEIKMDLGRLASYQTHKHRLWGAQSLGSCSTLEKDSPTSFIEVIINTITKK